MADVSCAGCGEPWDTHHLRMDEIWGAVDEGYIEKAVAESWNGRLDNEAVADAFANMGWRFAGSIYAVLECPSCQENGKQDDAEEKSKLVTVMSDLFGGDEDALICSINDMML